MHNDRLRLNAGEWELEMAPARGGAITALRHRGRDVLISPGTPMDDAMGSASFVLVPYANRIANGRFKFAGSNWTLPRNFGDHPHALHGTGWKRAWSVAARQEDAITLRQRHNADVHWPWAFEASQRILIGAAAVRFELDVTNTAPVQAPMGVGFHPAFAACQTTTLLMQVDGVWTIDAEVVPASLVPASEVLPELAGAAAGGGAPGVRALREELVDHCFTGWSRDLTLDNAGAAGDLNLRITASPELPFLQLYMPPGRSWLCVEPMSQMPDAINHLDERQDTGLRILAPGESLSVWMEISLRG